MAQITAVAALDILSFCMSIVLTKEKNDNHMDYLRHFWFGGKRL